MEGRDLKSKEEKIERQDGREGETGSQQVDLRLLIPLSGTQGRGRLL